MKILLIDPPGRVLGVSIALAHIVAVLKKNNHEVKILDLNNLKVKNNNELTKKIILDFRPDIIGLTLLSLTYYESMSLLKNIRKYYDAPIIVGGPQTFIEQEKLLYNEFIDVAVIGEGEETVVELADAFERKKSLEKIKGIIFKKNGEIIKTEKRPRIKNLDVMPFPDYKALGVEKFSKDGKNSYPLLTSRGCPHNCSFCYSAALYGRTWIGRKPESLIKELKKAKADFGCDSFYVDDDNFTLDIKRAEKFCDLLIKEKMKMSWSCLARADKITKNLARKMALSGCRSVQIGVESLVPDVFEKIEKGETIEDIKKAVKILKEEGMKIYSFFVIGLPGDTFERTMTSYKLSKNLAFDLNTWQNLIPIPKTKAHDWVIKNGRIVKDYKKQASILEIGFETPEFTRKEREKAFEIITTKEKAYPFDPQKSNIKNGLYTLKLIIKYDSLHIPAHINKISQKAFGILFKGKGELLSHAKFRKHQNHI